jgi:hypothetical protein
LFIAYYGSGKEVEVARAFKKYHEFKRLRPLIESLGLNKRFEIERLKEEV